MSNPLPELQPGDALLYYSGGLVDGFVGWRTWSDVAHVEIFMGFGQSSASRNGLGVDMYPFRPDGLKYIRRPVSTFDWNAGLSYAASMRGTPYGWGDLGRFYLLKIPTKGVICSQYGDLLWRAGNVLAFAEDYPAGIVSPRDFQVTPAAKTIWTYDRKS